MPYYGNPAAAGEGAARADTRAALREAEGRQRVLQSKYERLEQQGIEVDREIARLQKRAAAISRAMENASLDLREAADDVQSLRNKRV